MSNSNFHEIASPEEFQSLLSQDLSRVSLINFWAPWAEPCKKMNEIVLELAKKYPQLLSFAGASAFYWVRKRHFVDVAYVM